VRLSNPDSQAEVMRQIGSWLMRVKSRASKFTWYVAVFALLSYVVGLSFIFYSYLQQPNIDPILNLSPVGGLNYRLDISSFHPEFLEAQLEIVPEWDEFGSLTNAQLDQCGAQPHFSFGPLQVNDLSDNFNHLGLAPLQGGVRLFPKSSKLDSKPPGKVVRDFKVLGKPYLYPFDEYLIVGSVADEVHPNCDIHSDLPVSEGGFSYALHVPNMTLRSAYGRDLQDWPTEAKSWSLDPKIRQMLESQKKFERSVNAAGPDEYKFELWRQNRFAIVLERPMFLRQLTIALFVIAFASVVFVASTTPLNNWAPNIAGIFLTVWAIRSVLSSTAPNLPTLMDLGSLVIYLLGMTILVVRLIIQKQPLFSGRNSAPETDQN
jgi:hypothetical protein